MERRNVGILGATGAVGQRFIQLLADHPWFNITWLAASDRSAGKTYAEACHWRLDTPLPARIAKMVLAAQHTRRCNTELPRIIFSSIDAPIARELEPKFAAAGCAVISNSSAFRMAPDVRWSCPRSTPITSSDRAPGHSQIQWRISRHQPQLLRHRPRASARSAAVALRHREALRLHHAGGQRRGIPRRSLAGHPRQRHSLHQERRREVAGGSRQAARRSFARRLPGRRSHSFRSCAIASRSSTVTPSA
jgi:hypothetical protein